MILFDIRLEIEPPKVTHHAKELGMRYGKQGKLIPTMRDRPELEAARKAIAMGFGQCIGPDGQRAPRPRRPIDVRMILDITFCFYSEEIMWWGAKPDRDNLCKTFTDVLARDGWIARDELVVGGQVEKGCGPEPFIRAVAEPAKDEAWRQLYLAVRKPKET